ncbi:MAG: hypothetical protein Q9191_001531 [Dirinaria sp. TL-2023a]
MSRLALSDEDKQARDWFVGTTQSLGCKVDVDAMGNIYATRPGKKPGPPTCAGSHLDTQPTGGHALLTAAKLILHSHRLATVYGGCLASTGVLELKPGSPNTVPGYVKFSLDIRSEEDKRLLQFEEQLKVDFEKISQGADLGGLNAGIVRGNGCKVDWTLDSPSKAVRFNEECIQCVVDSAGELFGEDAAQLTQKMISGADCANGAQVLMGAVLRYDGLRAARNW